MIDHLLKTFKTKILDWVSPIIVHKEHVVIRDKLPIGIQKAGGSWIYPIFDNDRAVAGLRKIWLKREEGKWLEPYYSSRADGDSTVVVIWDFNNE